VADQTNDAHGALRGRAALAKALDTTWTLAGAALGVGAVNLRQVRAIVESLEALPDDLPDGVLDKAEAYLVEQADHLGPRELRHLGRGVLHHLAPEIADRAERRRLEAEDARAEATTQLRLRRRGDGTDEGWFRLPSHATGRLRAYLDAIANPHRADNDDDFMALPLVRRRGIAFQSLLERVLESDLPTHGSTATNIVVTISHEALVSGLGTATTSTGETLSAEQTRRLACNAGLLPAVLGGKGEILDLGRTSRFFKGPVRKAMDLRDKECTTRGCHVPAAFCHGHHFRQPWSRGGKTNLADGKLLCPHHHGRAHSPRWNTHHHPDGSTTFARRQ
jgi:hypothetical protein